MSWTCLHCGYENEDDNQYCLRCGAFISDARNFVEEHEDEYIDETLDFDAFDEDYDSGNDYYL